MKPVYSVMSELLSTRCPVLRVTKVTKRLVPGTTELRFQRPRFEYGLITAALNKSGASD
jgi:hypothetical protein